MMSTSLERLKRKLSLKAPRRNADESTKKPQHDTKAPGTSVPSIPSIPSRTEERRGLFVLHPETLEATPNSMNDVEIDVVAIHGLNGDAWKTWTDEVSGKMWLKDYLPNAIPNALIMTYGYNSSLAFSDSLANVDDFATDLLDRLRSLRGSLGEKAKTRPLIFICHSLGGIVVKKALILAHEAKIYYGDIAQCCSGILFMGTPHRGSNFTSWGRLLRQISNVVTISSNVRTDLMIMKKLETSSMVLKSISGQFVQRGKNLQIISFFERGLTSPLSTLVVQEDSAVMGIPNERAVPIDANHRLICRFSSRESQKYQPVEFAVMELVAHALQKKIDQPTIRPRAGLGSTGTTEFSLVPGRSQIGPAYPEITQPLRPVLGPIPGAESHRGAVEQPITDVNPPGDPLGGHTNATMITVRHFRGSVQLILPSDTLIEDLPQIISAQTGIETWTFELKLAGQREKISSQWVDILTTPVVVTVGKSRFSNSNELRINLDESLASFFSKAYPTPLEVELSPKPSRGVPIFSEKISVGSSRQKDLDICLMRTVRVPDNDGEYKLPPGLGRFPLFNIKTFESRLPQEMVNKGGIFFPVYQREAMWISFDSLTKKRFAIRPFVGGVNGISGRPAAGGMMELLQEMNDLTKGQDYLVLPEQRWLDGIAVSPGRVKQFVVTPMLSPKQNTARKRFMQQQTATSEIEVLTPDPSQPCEIGTSIESQVTGEDSVGGIQLEIIPEFNTERIYFSKTRNFLKRNHWDDKLAILKTPDEIGAGVGEVIHMKDMENLKPERKKLLKDLWNEVPGYQPGVSILELEMHPLPLTASCNSGSWDEVSRSGYQPGVSIPEPETHPLPLTASHNSGSWGEVPGYQPGVGILELEMHPLPLTASCNSGSPWIDGASQFKVLNFDGKTLFFKAKAMTVRQLKHQIWSKTGTEVQKQILTQRGKVLSDDHQLDLDGDKEFCVHLREEFPAALTVGAGGKISQNIEVDTNNPRIWDVNSRKILNIQLVNSASFEEITGFPTPPTPIDAKTYASLGLPFYDIYQEQPSSISGSFEGVKSLSQIDAQRVHQPGFVYDVHNPPACNLCHKSLADSLFRPCNHCACKTCADTVRKNAKKCPECQQGIERIISVSAPMGLPSEEGIDLDIPVVLLGATEGCTFRSIVLEN